MSVRIGLLLGDAAGIGPEIATRLLASGDALDAGIGRDPMNSTVNAGCHENPVLIDFPGPRLPTRLGFDHDELAERETKHVSLPPDRPSARRCLRHRPRDRGQSSGGRRARSRGRDRGDRRAADPATRRRGRRGRARAARGRADRRRPGRRRGAAAGAVDRSGTGAAAAGPADRPEAVPLGEVSALAGKAVLDGFRMALGLAAAGELDAICFAPCNKQAMHEGGLELEDELRFFVQVLDFKGYVGEVNATDQLATTRVTSHVPLKAVAGLITGEGVLQAIRLAHSDAGRRRQAASQDRGRGPQPARRRWRPLRPRGDRDHRARGRARAGPADRGLRAPIPPIPCSCGRAMAPSMRSSPCTTTRARSR